MNQDLIDKLIVAIAGVSFGAILSYILTTYRNLTTDKLEVKVGREIYKAKEVFLRELKDLYIEAQKNLSEVNYTLGNVNDYLEEATKNSQKINAVREQAEKIVADIKSDTGVNTQDVAEILKPELLLGLTSTLMAEVNNAKLELKTDLINQSSEVQDSVSRGYLNLISSGVVHIEDDALRTQTGERIIRRRVMFPEIFNQVPIIYHSLNMIDTSSYQTVRINTYVSNISREGFDLCVGTWMNNKIFGVKVSWIAFGSR